MATAKQMQPPTRPRKKICLYTSLWLKPNTAIQENINPLCGMAENVEELMAAILCTTSGDNPAAQALPNAGITIPRAPEADAVTNDRNPVSDTIWVITPPGNDWMPPSNTLNPGAEATTLPTPTAAAVNTIGMMALVAPVLRVLS
jgi:hypothetical protein